MATTVGDLVVKVRADTANLKSGLDSVTRSAGDTGMSFGKLTAAIGLGNIAATAITATIGALTEQFKKSWTEMLNLDTAMRKINVIAKQSEDGFNGMKEAVMEMSLKVPLATQDIAEGLYDIVSAMGYTEQSTKLAALAADVAVGGFTKMSVATDVLTSVMNAYGLKTLPEASKAMDILFKGVQLGKFDFEQLASSIGIATAEASKVGVSLEEVTAAMVNLNNAGFNAAESATILSGVLRSIYSPSKEASDIAASLGLQWDLSALQAKGLNGVLMDMIEKTHGNQDAMIGLMGDARAVRGALVLASDGGNQFNKTLEQMKSSEGGVDAAVKEANKSWQAQWQLIQNNVSKTFGEFVDTVMPKVIGAVSYIAELVGTASGQFRKMASDIDYNIRKFLEWTGLVQKQKGMEFGTAPGQNGAPDANGNFSWNGMTWDKNGTRIKQFGGYVNETGLYMLHAGEKVEAQPSASYQDNRNFNVNVGGGGGGGWSQGRAVGFGLQSYEASFR